MEWLRTLSDNQLALLGCLGALVISFGLVGGSYHLGRIFRHGRGETDGMPTPQSTGVAQEQPARRRAA